MLAIFYGLECQLFRDGISAYQFDNDVYVRMSYDGVCIVDDHDVIARYFSRLFHITISNHADDDSSPRTPADFFLIALEYRKSSPAYGSYA